MMLGEVTQGIAKHGHLPRFLSKENRYGAPTYALVVTGVIASAMLLCNYSQSIAGLFTLFSVVVTAANMPVYFACSLAIVVLKLRGVKGIQGAPAMPVAVAAACATAYCAWVSIGVGLKPLLWTLGLCALGLPLYWVSRLVRSSHEAVVPPSIVSQCESPCSAERPTVEQPASRTARTPG
jgi:APA family basic amino acid/polyamine antiporter